MRKLLERKRADSAGLPHSVEHYEELIERTAQHETATLSCTVSLAVLRLLHSSTTTLADRAMWPKVSDIAQSEIRTTVSYQPWIKRRARDAGGPWAVALKWRPEYGPPSTPDSKALQ